MMPLYGPFPIVEGSKKRPFELLEDHQDTQFVDFDRLPQFMKIMARVVS